MVLATNIERLSSTSMLHSSSPQRSILHTLLFVDYYLNDLMPSSLGVSTMLVQSPAMHSETALGQAAAALPLVVVNPRHWSLTSDSYFAANIDKAEKGSFESAKPHTIMKRSPTASRNGTVQSLESQVSGPTNQAGLEQAFSTSIDTNPQENVPVEDTASTVTGGKN